MPFDSDTIGNPALDVGDILSFTGGQADATKIACITLNSIKIGGRQSIKCVGKNPKLSRAKSKNDKNISGLLAQIEAGKIGIHTFTNAFAFTVREVNMRENIGRSKLEPQQPSKEDRKMAENDKQGAVSLGDGRYKCPCGYIL